MKKTDKHDSIIFSSINEIDYFKKFMEHFKNHPLPNDEILHNLGLFLTSKNLARLLFFYEIYKKIVNTHGVIIEFGTRWGQTLSVMSSLRGIFEPFNRHRKIIGFDTFKGFAEVNNKDGASPNCDAGSFSVSKNYEDYLDKILHMQEQLNPMAHVKRYEIIKGNACQTVPLYFKKHLETIVSLAMFDFDLYKPTKIALETIKPHLVKGSILIFDELSDDVFPGETLALDEVLGLNNVRIQRFPMASRISYIIME